MKTFFLNLGFTFFFCSIHLWGFAQNITLWNGETPDIANCVFSNGSADNSNPHNGQWAFKAELTQWNSATINLKCQNTYRLDLSQYTELQFYIKSNTEGVMVKMALTGWPNPFQTIDISPYIQNGLISGQYKLVKIPISALKTPGNLLQSVEQIRLELQHNAPVTIYVDDFTVLDLEANQVDSINLLSNQVIRLNIKERFDMDHVQNLTHYQLSSPDDKDYAVAQIATLVGRHFYVKKFHESTVNPVIKNELFVQFGKPLKNGKTYILKVVNIKDLAGNDFPAPQLIEFKFNEETLINHSVKVNQVGYFPIGPKYGYIGNYMGDAGMMTVLPTQFEIRLVSNNQMVFSGVPSLRGDDSILSGERIFECDFSNLNTPGKYYLYVPGIGRSFNFEIDEKVMDQVYYATARSLFYQRCGVALQPPYADPKWSHQACHSGDGISHSSWLNSSLYKGESINTHHAMPMGWHDAGDYGKYTMTATSALYYLFTIYQMYPEKFGDNELNLPESGNMVPDILDEARHEINWLMNMQAKDGAVFERVTSLEWPKGMPENDLATRYIAEKTTHTTGQFAAIMAMAYRNFLPHWPDFAEQCLLKSKSAMEFLIKNPGTVPEQGYNPALAGMGGGDYPDPEGDQDERAWAAAELYKATGSLKYRDLFDTYWAQHPPMWGWNPFQHHQINASVAYATTTFPVDQSKVNSIKTAIINQADNYLIPRTNQNFYRSACRTDVVAFLGWGAYGQSSKYSWDLIMAHYFSGADIYKKYALINLDVQLGNNPQNKTYITGIGSNSPMNPLHHPSLADNTDEPVPGIPVFGPNAHLSENNPYNVAVQHQSNLYPSGETENSPYPILRRYYDISSNVAMSEFNIIDETLTSSVYGFFKSLPIQSPEPEINIKLNYFNAEIIGEAVQLTWETDKQLDTYHFSLEKSSDGVNFEGFVKVGSKGFSNTPLEYLYTDNNPYQITSYYRLKITDKYGNSLHSNIETINIPGTLANEFNIFPNPVSDKLTIMFPSTNLDNSEWEMMIINMEGRKMLFTKGSQIDIQKSIDYSINKIPPGIYILQLKNQEIEFTEKFIKE